MKTRVCVTALFLSLTGPAVLSGMGLLPASLGSPLAFADDAVTEVARQRFQDGVKASDAGRHEEARAAFLQAYTLKKHPAVLLNLGQAELKSNHVEDGGNHLQQFLREMPTAAPDQKAAAEKGIAEAKRRTGHIVVLVDAQGADITVDGTVVGKSPMLSAIFVKTGAHTVTATYGGKSVNTSVDAKLNQPAVATLALGVAGSPATGPSGTSP
ncbi:MAG TPA: hypothetical protein PK156_42830, partial [Polyangium sp.]|nr:hypothetical protein [Polyangium sp.]